MAETAPPAPPRASGFPAATEAEWRALVARALAGAPVESLGSQTCEGIPVAPLYAPAPRRSAPLRAADAGPPWEIVTLTAHPDPARANGELLADLEGGAAGCVLRLDRPGQTGVAVGSAGDLARLLDGVILEAASMALDAGFLGPLAAGWLDAAAKASPGARLRFHLDPISAFAEAGGSPGPIEAHLALAGATGAGLAETYPQAQLFLASGRVIHEAGGGEAGEVAFAAAAGLAYAKAVVGVGLPIAEAFGRITLSLSADADYFLSAAKLRAARAVWARVAGACGAEGSARIEARSSHRMLAARDAWTNMIRLSLAGFGAALGGADAIVLGCFSDPLGLPTPLARRQSRNAQLILMEEGHVGRVADPAGGSGFVEAMTEALARAAWERFQAIERAGGLIAALKSGLIAQDVEAARAARPEPAIVGVTVSRPPAETAVEVEIPSPRAAAPPPVGLPGPDSACPPLRPLRLAEPFE